VGLRAPFVAAALTYLALVTWASRSLAAIPAPERPPEPPPEIRTRPVNQA
jgi:hypothetical protein